MAYSYRQIVEKFKSVGIESAQYDARALIAEICNEPWASVAADPDREYDSERLCRAVEKRSERYPLQYILGKVGFFNGTFTVSEATLIPRPDTEMIAEYAIENLPTGACFADLCTGSGCIAVSVLMERRDTKALATDISDGALSVAARNAEQNGVADRITFLNADVKAPNSVKSFGPFDAIISNPPYIPTEEAKKLEPEVLCEPFSALDGGASGYEFYSVMIPGYLPYLKPDGELVLEIGYDQGEKIKEIAECYGLNCRIFKDYGGKDRMAVINIEKGKL